MTMKLAIKANEIKNLQNEISVLKEYRDRFKDNIVIYKNLEKINYHMDKLIEILNEEIEEIYRNA